MNMTKTHAKPCLSMLLCTLLIAALALGITGCNDSTKETPQTPAGTSAGTQASDGTAEGDQSSGVIVKGEGNTIFYFNVVDGQGNETKFEIHTNETTVGAALISLGLIQGEEGPYGLYVKSVNGITTDYDTDGTYWAFYVNGDYGMTGVDVTTIEAGATYAFKVSK